jgi:hypothetical protein
MIVAIVKGVCPKNHFSSNKTSPIQQVDRG